jgi:two-component system alkaline phosphatase synthesis response regulator PhoP
MKELIFTAMQQSGKDSFTLQDIVNIIDNIENVQIVESCGIVVDKSTWTIKNKGKVFNVPKKEFLIIHYFITNSNKKICRDTLLNDIWGSDIIVGGRTIDVHIRKIRSKFPEAPIETLKGVGYIWNG